MQVSFAVPPLKVLVYLELFRQLIDVHLGTGKLPNIARIAKAASHKLPGKFKCQFCPVLSYPDYNHKK